MTKQNIIPNPIDISWEEYKKLYDESDAAHIKCAYFAGVMAVYEAIRHNVVTASQIEDSINKAVAEIDSEVPTPEYKH